MRKITAFLDITGGPAAPTKWGSVSKYNSHMHFICIYMCSCMTIQGSCRDFNPGGGGGGGGGGGSMTLAPRHGDLPTGNSPRVYVHFDGSREGRC